MVRICHTADWHLSSNAACAGKIVRDENGVNIRWKDQQRVVKAFVDGAIAQECEVAIIAGDIFDTPKPGPAEIVFAQEEIRRLAKEMMLVVLIHGNHDMPVSGAPSPVAILAEIVNVSYLESPTVIHWPDLEIAALPFPSKSSLLARDEYQGLSPEGVNALVSEKLRAIVRGLRAQCDPHLPSVLVAHLPIVGAKMNENMLAGQEHISLTAEDLEGWEYVALGDFHAAQQVGPRAYYSGSLDRLNHGEEGNEPSWACVELDGETFSKTDFPMPARRFITLTPEEIRDTVESEEYWPNGLDYNRVPILRVKGELSQEEHDALQPTLAKWREIPTFTEQLEITRTTRARAEEMKGDITPTRALAEWHAANSRTEDLGELTALHAEIAGK
jgi:exonuclease SbcD